MIQRGFFWLRLRAVSAWLVKMMLRSVAVMGLAIALSFWLPAAAAAVNVTFPLPTASIHTYQERPGQTTFRSKQSLRDRSDRSWQVILFKRYQAEDLQGLYLRLVGFPGLVALDSRQPIVIATGTSAQWIAQPVLDAQTQSLPENASQYDVATAFADLAGDIPLQVNIPLMGGGTAQLVVPPFAVHEWRALSSQSPD